MNCVSLDVKTFLKKCTTKKLQDMEIGASHLELTDSILVEGDMSTVKEDVLTLYFSNKNRSGGGEIKSLIWVNKHKRVVISFEKSQGTFYSQFCYHKSYCKTS